MRAFSLGEALPLRAALARLEAAAAGSDKSEAPKPIPDPNKLDKISNLNRRPRRQPKPTSGRGDRFSRLHLVEMKIVSKTRPANKTKTMSRSYSLPPIKRTAAASKKPTIPHMAVNNQDRSQFLISPRSFSGSSGRRISERSAEAQRCAPPGVSAVHRLVPVVNAGGPWPSAEGEEKPFRP
jgi:hypothetical protein